MKHIISAAIFMLFSVCLVNASFAHEGHGDIPAKVDYNHWSCVEINQLAEKYDVHTKPLAAGERDRKELAEHLLAIIEKVMDKCEKEGTQSVPAEDIERISVLHTALHNELAQYEGYLQRRESIEKILAKPETPDFEYKLGLNGFTRGEWVNNFRLLNFTHTTGHGEGRFLYRVKPYLYWHPTGYLDLHAEGQAYGFNGGSQEYDKSSLYQGFMEAKIPGSDLLALKAGRQEFNYGSAFILGPDSFFDGLSFDGARLRLKPAGPFAVDILAGAYAKQFSGGARGNLAGAYATYSLNEGNTVEAYAFRDSGSTGHHVGEELYTWGGRFFAKAGPVGIELEPAYQSGRSLNTVTGVNDRIDAFGGHLDLTAESTLAGFNNKLFASYAYGSGSKDAANGISTAREFRNPNNDSSLVGDMNVLGDLSGIAVNGHHASGLQIYTLGWGVDLTKELNFSATGRYFRANNVEDSFSRRLGIETDFTLTYTLSDGLSLLAGYDRFFTGGFFRNASGSDKDIEYGYLMVQFDLSKSKPRMKPAKG